MKQQQKNNNTHTQLERVQNHVAFSRGISFYVALLHFRSRIARFHSPATQLIISIQQNIPFDERTQKVTLSM